MTAPVSIPSASVASEEMRDRAVGFAMLKALLWKEWREQRPIAFTGALVALMIPAIAITSATGSGAPDLLEVVDIVVFLSAVVVWPLFAALAGAAACAERASSASSTFLLSRPIGRARMWLIKVAVASVSIGFVVAVSFYASFRIYLWAGGQEFRFPFGSDPLPLSPDVVRALAVGGVLVTFCSALLLSTFMKRSMAAALAGLAVGIGSQVIGLVAAGRVGEQGVVAGAGAFLTVYSDLLAAAFLLASLYVFRARGLVGSGAGGGALIRATVGVVAVVPLVMACAGWTSTRITPDNALVEFRHVVPGTDGVVVRLYRNGFADSSLWVATPDAPLRRLTTRLTRAIAVSPNGEWLAYVSRRSFLGTRSSRCDVRAVRIDGTGDRRLLTIDSPTWCVGNAAFAQDSERLAVKTGSRYRFEPGLFLVSLVGDRAREFDVSLIVAAFKNSSGYGLEWLSRDELLISSPSKFWRVHTTDGTVLSTYERDWRGPYTRDLARAGSLRLVWENHGLPWTLDGPVETKLIDLADGSTREIEPLCAPTLKRQRDDDGEWLRNADGEWYWEPTGPVAALSADRSRVFYTCPRPLLAGNNLEIVEYAGPWESTLIRRDLVTGVETALAKLDGRVFGLSPMSDSKRLIAHYWENLGGPAPISGHRTAILDENGTWRTLDPGREWEMAGWLGDQRLLLRGYGGVWFGTSQPLAYLDIAAPTEPRPFNLTGEWRR